MNQAALLTLLAMSDTFELFLLSLPPMLSREPAFDSEVKEPPIFVLTKIVIRKSKANQAH